MSVTIQYEYHERTNGAGIGTITFASAHAENEALLKFAAFNKKLGWPEPRILDVRTTAEVPEPRTARVPIALRELSITWTSEMVDFIQSLAASPVTQLQLETTDSLSKKIEDKYYELTGKVIVPTPAEYTVSPDDSKWGTKGSLIFDTNITVPDSLDVTFERDGRINNTELFWAFVRLGFRLGCGQDQDGILKNIPKLRHEA